MPDGTIMKDSDHKSVEAMMCGGKVHKKSYGGRVKKMKEGGKLKMVEKGGEQVPFYAADGVGKMNYGGKVKKMKNGGKCRGMGAATSGGNFKMR